MANFSLLRNSMLFVCAILLAVTAGCDRKPKRSASAETTTAAEPSSQQTAETAQASSLNPQATDYYDVITWDEAIARYPNAGNALEGIRQANVQAQLQEAFDACGKKHISVEECVSKSNARGMPLPFDRLLKNLRALKSKLEPKQQASQVESVDLLIKEIELLREDVDSKVVLIDKRDGNIFVVGRSMLTIIETGLANYGLRTSPGGILGSSVTDISPLLASDWYGLTVRVKKIHEGRLKGAYADEDGSVILPGLKCFDPKKRGLRIQITRGVVASLDD